MEGLTMDSDYGYIYTFIQYLNMLFNMIISAFQKLAGSTSTAETTTTAAAENSAEADA